MLIFSAIIIAAFILASGIATLAKAVTYLADTVVAAHQPYWVFPTWTANASGQPIAFDFTTPPPKHQ